MKGFSGTFFNTLFSTRGNFSLKRKKKTFRLTFFFSFLPFILNFVLMNLFLFLRA